MLRLVLWRYLKEKHFGNWISFEGKRANSNYFFPEANATSKKSCLPLSIIINNKMILTLDSA